MSYPFELSGKILVDLPPASSTSSTSGDFTFRASLLEQVALEKKFDTVVSLGDDAEETVSLADLDEAHVVFLRILTLDGGPVLARLTHADGTSQCIPVDPFFLLVSEGSGVTSLTLQRSPDVFARVQVFCGEKEA